MRFDVLTLFPGIFRGPLDETILRRAQDAGLVEVQLHNLRDWATDPHRSVDDYPFGGGPGMVMKPEPIFAAVEAIQPLAEPPATVVLMTPQGHRLDHALVDELAAHPRLLLVCGRYEGVDERVIEQLVDVEVSVADVVVSGGELPALLLLDALARRVPGCWAARAPSSRSRSRAACSSTRSTRAPPSSGARPCPTCCSPATTPRSRAGGASSASRARADAGRTCSRPPSSPPRTAPGSTPTPSTPTQSPP